MQKNVLAVIPARLESQRLPRKVLLAETGLPLIKHVHQHVVQAKKIDRIIVATDSEEVIQTCEKFGIEAHLTAHSCQSGTDRVAEIARRFPDYDCILNVQGDEPEMCPKVLDELIENFQSKSFKMGTVATPWPKDLPLERPENVKVVLDLQSCALYFSRSPIPFQTIQEEQKPTEHYRHIGLYIYKSDFLDQYASWKQTPLEQAEKLEQLRALEYGHKIFVLKSSYTGREINTPEDYKAFVRDYCYKQEMKD